MDDTSIPLDATVAAARRRARRYWSDDGLTEVAVGILLMLGGLLFYMEATAPENSRRASMSALLLPLLAIGGVMVVRFGVGAMKERLTYRRTGYVASSQAERTNRRPAALVAVIIAAAAAALLARTPASLSLLPALDGLVVAAFLVVTAYRQDIARFYALAVLSVLIGVAVALAGLGDELGTGAYFGAFGLALAIAGAAVLVRYFRQTSPSAPA